MNLPHCRIETLAILKTMFEHLSSKRGEEGDPHKASPINTGQVKKFSGLIKKDGLTPGFRATYADSASGREFVEVKEKSAAAGQEFFAKLLKGLLPISDIEHITIDRPLLRKKETRGSLIVPLKNAESVTESELIVDDLIMHHIFKEGDRGRKPFFAHNVRSKRDTSVRTGDAVEKRA